MITIVLALIYSFCFEDAVSLLKDTIFVKLHCIIAELQGLRVNFPYICCNFCRDCTPAKMATETLERSIDIDLTRKHKNQSALNSVRKQNSKHFPFRRQE